METGMFGFFKKSRQKTIFNELVQKALSDNILTDEEYAEIIAKAEEFNIPKSEIDLLRTKHYQTAIKPITDVILSEMKMSPDQEAQIKQIANNLSVSSQLGAEFIKCRQLWEFENNPNWEPEPFDTNLVLQKNETAYTYVAASWEQLKKKRVNHGYVGGSVGFRVAKGVRLSVGRAIPITDEYEEMTEISSGILIVTNKRMIFNGNRKSNSTTRGRILDYEVFADGIQIKKSSGQPDFYRMDGIDTVWTAAVMDSILR